ncbi:hypothetical protein [Cellulomonas triticagri]|uniref:hypothetical protein n=1 Tax=Cellulomonas triticagri TaxID=2483352 RepID=UPI0011C411DA|nr:hypothetical protein [Cellulomonas triticagri]
MGMKQRAISRPTARLVALVPVVGLGWVVFALAMLDAGGVLGVGVAAVCLTVLVVGAALVVWLALVPRRGRLPVVVADGRLWLPVAPVPRVGLVALAGMAVLLGVVVVTGLVVDGLGALLSLGTDTRRGRAFPFLLLGGSVGGAAACVPLLVGLVRGTRGPRRFGLGPDGLLREAGHRIPAVLVPWRDIGAVVVERSRRRVLVHRLAGPVGGDPVVIAAPLHGADPAAVAALIERYRDDPSARERLPDVVRADS